MTVSQSATAARIWSALVTIIMSLACMARACGPAPELSFQQKVDMADVLLLGQVRRKYPDPRFTDAYTAEMTLICVLKAPPAVELPVVTNITQAGYIGGRCFTPVLEPNKRYIILGSRRGDVISPTDATLEATAPNIMQANELCGLSPRLPTGADETSGSRLCPSAVDENGCIVSGTVVPETSAPVTEPEPHDHTHDHHHDDHHDHHDDHDHDHHHDYDHDHDHDHDHHDDHHDHDHDHDHHDDHHDHDHDHDHHDDHDHHHDHDHDPEAVKASAQSPVMNLAILFILTLFGYMH